MSINRIHELELLRTGITLPPEEHDSGRLFLISGIFGTGKSWAIDRLTDELIAKSAVDAVMKVRLSDRVKLLPELAKELIESFEASDDCPLALNAEETYYNHEKFMDCLYEIKNKEYTLYEHLLRMQTLRSYQSHIEQEEANPIDKKEIESLINALFVKKGDRRLLLETEAVVVESLIVDLMNKYYPLNEEFDSYESYLKQIKLKKIVIIFDDIDSADYSISHLFCDTLLAYSWERPFESFISYKISNLNPKLKVSDFFDFRFIISGRRELLGDTLGLNWNRYDANVKSIRFEPLSLVQIAEYVDSLEIELPVSIDEIYQKTKGIHKFFVQCLDSIGTDTKNPCLNINYDVLLEDVFRDKNDEQRDWFVSTAFLGEFDEEGLRCFPEIADNRFAVFKYLRNCSEYNITNGKIELDKTIKELLKDYIFMAYPELAGEYSKTGLIYEEVKPVLANIALEDREIVRNLAYFDRFDVGLPLGKPFNISGSRIDDAIDKYEMLFVRNKFTWSLKAEYEVKLQNYNTLIDLDYDDKKALAKKTWNKFFSEIGQKVMINEQTILDSNDEIKTIKGELETIDKEYLNYQTIYFDSENRLLEHNKKLEKYTLRKNLSLVIKNFIFALITCAGLYYAPLYTKGTLLGQEPILEIFIYSLYSIGGLFLLLVIAGLLKYTAFQGRIAERKEIVRELMKHERERNKSKTSMEESSEQKHIREERITELLALVEELQNDINHLRNRLVEN